MTRLDREPSAVTSPPEGNAPAESSPIPFRSILFSTHDQAAEPAEAPAYFHDLNLDQVIESICAGREEYNLESFFYAPLHDVDAIAYRHEVLRDLEDDDLLRAIKSFEEQMQRMRKHLKQAEELHYLYQKEAWLLAAVQIYCAAVVQLRHDLATDLSSRGFLALRAYTSEYVESEGFTALAAETRQLKAQLADVRYCVHIRGNKVRVSNYDGEADYSAEVEATFEKFKKVAAGDYRVELRTSTYMNHVEAQVLDRVARLYPDVFSALDDYCRRHRDSFDDTLLRFDREVQFFLACLDYVREFQRAGLNFCYPRVSDTSKEVEARETFDLALANALVPKRAPVVCNDLRLTDAERIFIVSGPNQGGKTTFARTFGQLHYFGALGCLVPGREAQLFLFDRMFTHFEKEEDIKDLRGKLQDDLVRIQQILEQATTASIVIMNEIFTSTTLQDATFLGREVVQRIVEIDLLCVCVTFVDELASVSHTTVSMVSSVVPDDPAQRTYKVVRKPADGLAYAVAIAEKYNLTYERLKERIEP